MVWLLIVPLIIVWAIIQKSITDTTGQYPRTRGSLRYQRRKARKLSVDAEDVPINPRLVSADEDSRNWIDRNQWWFALVAIVLWALILWPVIFRK
jgi:hypothetical protein